MIYEFALQPPTEEGYCQAPYWLGEIDYSYSRHYENPYGRYFDPTCIGNFQLLQTCQQAYKEGLGVFLGNLTFLVMPGSEYVAKKVKGGEDGYKPAYVGESLHVVNRWLADLGVRRRFLIKCLSIRVVFTYIEADTISLSSEACLSVDSQCCDKSSGKELLCLLNALPNLNELRISFPEKVTWPREYERLNELKKQFLQRMFPILLTKFKETVTTIQGFSKLKFDFFTIVGDAETESKIELTGPIWSGCEVFGVSVEEAQPSGNDAIQVLRHSLQSVNICEHQMIIEHDAKALDHPAGPCTWTKRPIDQVAVALKYHKACRRWSKLLMRKIKGFVRKIALNATSGCVVFVGRVKKAIRRMLRRRRWLRADSTTPALDLYWPPRNC